MSIPVRPRLRPLDTVPLGQDEWTIFEVRDPLGFGQTVHVSRPAALLLGLMDGKRTLADIQGEFRGRAGVPVSLVELERLVHQLDDAYLLESRRFESYRRDQVEAYLAAPVRPAAHAGGSYPVDPEELRELLDDAMTGDGGPGPIDPAATPDGRPLRAVVSPHVDLYRGAAAYAWAYKAIAEETDADLFVILGTAHTPMESPFSVTRKNFATPLGPVRTDAWFVDRLAEQLAESVAGRQIDLEADELVQRREHSIEFQAVFLQHVLGGKRDFCIVPILVGAFCDMIDEGASPEDSPEVEAFLAALAVAETAHPGRVCYVSAADLAHVGRRFGDDWPVDDRRAAEQEADDLRLLHAACAGDAAGFFGHVAAQGDRSRICGLAPTYVTLRAARAAHGKLLRYDQAVEPDRSACVSFASVALYG